MNYYSYMNQRNSATTVAMDALGGERTRGQTSQASEKSPKDQSLEEHDRKFHPNGYKPGDTCKFREGLEAYSDTDDIGEALNWQQKSCGRYLSQVHSSARFVKEIPPSGKDDIAYGGKRIARATLPPNTDPNKKLEAMYALAEANIGTLSAITQKTGKEAGYGVMERKPNQAYKNLPIKTWKRAKQKSDTWHRDAQGNFGDYQQLNDLIGTTLILKDNDSYADALEHLDNNVRKFGAQIAQVKPYNLTTGKPGYRDLKVTLRFPNGGLGEVILIEDYMNQQKNANCGHAAYEAYRTFNGMIQCGDRSPETLQLAKDVDEMMNTIYERDASKIDDQKFAAQKQRVGEVLKRIVQNPDSFMAKMPEDYRREIADFGFRQQSFEQERTDNLKALESVILPDKDDPTGLSKWDRMTLTPPENRIRLSNQSRPAGQPSQRPLTTGSQT